MSDPGIILKELAHRCRHLWKEIQGKDGDFYGCVREFISDPHFTKLAHKALSKQCPQDVSAAIDCIVDHVKSGALVKFPSGPDITPELEYIRHHLKNLDIKDAAQQVDAPDPGSNA